MWDFSRQLPDPPQWGHAQATLLSRAPALLPFIPADKTLEALKPSKEGKSTEKSLERCPRTTCLVTCSAKTLHLALRI